MYQYIVMDEMKLMVTTMMIYCDKTLYPSMLKIVEKDFHFLNL